jgi:hypothetical protein
MAGFQNNRQDHRRLSEQLLVTSGYKKAGTISLKFHNYSKHKRYFLVFFTKIFRLVSDQAESQIVKTIGAYSTNTTTSVLGFKRLKKIFISSYPFYEDLSNYDDFSQIHLGQFQLPVPTNHSSLTAFYKQYRNFN